MEQDAIGVLTCFRKFLVSRRVAGHVRTGWNSRKWEVISWNDIGVGLGQVPRHISASV